MQPPPCWTDNTTHVPWSQRALEIGLCALLLSPSLFFPIGRDHGLFAYCGQIILDGGVPYRDVYEQKGPATHYTFAMILAVFGQTWWGIRLFFFLLALAGTQLAAQIANGLGGSKARLVTAVCYALVSIQGRPAAPGMSAQVEDILLPLTLAAVWLLADNNRVAKTGYVFLAWALMGLACVYKPTIATSCVTAAIVFAYWVIRNRSHLSGSVATYAMASVAGFLLPSVVFGVFLVAQGAFDDFWMFVVNHNSRVYARLRIGSASFAFLMFAYCWGSLGLLALAGFLVGRKRPSLLRRLIVALAVGGLWSVIWQGKYAFAYHWTPLAGTLTILAGLAPAKLIHWARDSQRTTAKRRLAYGAVVLLIATVPTSTSYYLWLCGQACLVAVGQKEIEELQETFPVGTDSFAVQTEVADYIRQRTDADDTVLVWGMDVVLNFLSDRRSPSRFALNRTLTHTEFRHVHGWREEFLACVRAKPPAYVVVADDKETQRPWYEMEASEDLDGFSSLQQIIENDYSLEKRIGQFDLYRWKDDGRLSGEQPERTVPVHVIPISPSDSGL